MALHLTQHILQPPVAGRQLQVGRAHLQLQHAVLVAQVLVLALLASVFAAYPCSTMSEVELLDHVTSVGSQADGAINQLLANF